LQCPLYSFFSVYHQVPELYLGVDGTQKQILENYPQLEGEDVEAALRYVAEILQDELVYPYP